jgi:hypothetical protein
MSNVAVTTRIALDCFEYDPYGYKPDWWQLSVICGQAFEHKEHATIKVTRGTLFPRTGDRIYLTQDCELGVWTPEQFKVRCRHLDENKEAAALFKERSADGVHKYMEKLRELRK